MDVYDTICGLLRHADPELENHKRLLKYKSQVERNVMLSPKANRFIQSLVQLKNDNIECSNLARDGLCRVRKRVCDYAKEGLKYRNCLDFKETKEKTDRPLSPLGGF